MDQKYENPDKPKMIRNLQFSVELYKDIIALRDPYYDFLKLRAQVIKDHEEYTLLRKDLTRLDYFKIVKSYLDKFKSKQALGDYMESIGEYIDRGNWTTLFEDTGRTYDEEYGYIRAAYALNPKEKAIFLRRYNYLLDIGNQDLITFQNRELQNRINYNNSLSNIINQDLEQHKRAITKAEDKFKRYQNYPTPLYFTASELNRHLHTLIMNNANDEYTEIYLTPDERARIAQGELYTDALTTGNLPRVEKFIEKIARNEILLTDINKPKPKTIEEDQM